MGTECVEKTHVTVEVAPKKSEAPNLRTQKKKNVQKKKTQDFEKMRASPDEQSHGPGVESNEQHCKTQAVFPRYLDC